MNMQIHCTSHNQDATSQMAEKPITTRRLAADEKGIAEAAAILRAGGLVAFPTETVYGLGADATNGEAVARIYAAKGRPSFNPLIVHVCDIDMADRIGVIVGEARDLVQECWPEPVTIVVPLREDAMVSELVTAGQPSVALRMPKSDIALALIRETGRPLAAPSANPSGRVSATTAEHVLAGLDGKIDAVIDGGPTPVGLESTIIGFLDDKPRLLREGAFSVTLPDIRIDAGVAEKPVAPGQLASHYAPLASVRLNATKAEPDEFLLGFGYVKGDLTLSAEGSLTEAAANLYAMLHEIDARGVTRLAVAPIPDESLGRAINDRLRRAAAPRD
jgi:L-threonylcarbamoyladenylate synthase